MDNYDIFKVWGDSEGVRLHSTDTTELNWVATELKKFQPRLHVKYEDKLPSGDIYFYLIDRLSGDAGVVCWWVIKQLCLHGWEPIGATGFVQGGGSAAGMGMNTVFHYLFRRKG